MRPGSVLLEAWRNLWSGTTRTGIWALVFIATVGLVAVADVRAVVGVLQGAVAFQAGGGSVQVLQATGLIDGSRCDKVADATGVAGAGAMRWAAPLEVWNLPSTPITHLEVTPGFLTVIRTVGADVRTDPAVVGGVWIATDLADTLGVGLGGTLHVGDETTIVAGLYTWPSDGRNRDIAYAILTPVPGDGAFTQCWADIWPANSTLDALMYTSVNGSVTPTQIQSGQLNGAFGTSFDAVHHLSTRLTRLAPAVAALLGLAIGFAAVRIRRVEIASARGARMSLAATTWQQALEAVVWLLLASMITGAALLWASRSGNPDASAAVWVIGLRSLATGVATTLIGVGTAALTIRPTSLYRYTKST